jgi:hypothetical protein
MADRFRPGDTAYAANGTQYVVEDVDGDTIYCALPSGAEAEFPASALSTAAEWAARSDKRRGQLYDRLKQARAYTELPLDHKGGKLDAAAAAQVVARSERLLPGILDFTAFATATRIVGESGDHALADGLSIGKCRAVFDAARPEIQAGLLAALLGTPVEPFVAAGRLGDNLLRALLDKGMLRHAAAFENFGDRRRQ